MSRAKRRAFITGIGGQDGSYLAEYLLSLGYEVWGLERKASTRTGTARPHLLSGDMRNAASLKRALKAARPDEIYNLAAQTEIGRSIKNPKETFEINYKGFGHLVDAALAQNPKVRIFQAGTSEMLAPKNPYGESKFKAHREVVERHRAKHKLFICSGILFNHISPRSGENSVARKITLGLVHIKQGKLKKLSLGNLDAKRDWGFAGDYVRAMHAMLQQKKPRDYVIASSSLHSVREFVTLAARELGIPIKWNGKGVREVGKDKDGAVIVDVKKEFYRPAEKAPMRGNSAHARKELGWKPVVSFKELIKMMVRADLANR